MGAGMKILALDIATTTGIAIGNAGDVPQAWSERLGEKKDEDELFSNSIRFTSDLIVLHRPDLIAYEGAVGGDRSSHFLVGMIACIRGSARNRGVKVMACNIGAIRKSFIGQHITSANYKHLPARKRKAAARAHIKSAVQTACKMRGWGDLDEDAADACAVWEYACVRKAPGYHAHVGGLFA